MEKFVTLQHPWDYIILGGLIISALTHLWNIVTTIKKAQERKDDTK